MSLATSKQHVMQTAGKQLAWISNQGIVSSYLNP
jgi:hypothetical protein